MNMTVLMATLFLTGGSVLAASAADVAISSQGLQLAQDSTATMPDSIRTDRIDRNTEARTNDRIERREGAADAAGMPGLDQGIVRRNDRREDRREELRTGQPPETASSPQ